MNRLTDRHRNWRSSVWEKRMPKSLAAEGARVMVSDLDDPSRVVAEIKASGGTATSTVADVTDDASIALQWSMQQKKNSVRSILGQQRGPSLPHSCLTPIMEMSNGAWDKTMTVNVRGTFQCIKAVKASMLKNGRGKIINVSSRNLLLRWARHGRLCKL